MDAFEAVDYSWIWAGYLAIAIPLAFILAFLIDEDRKS